ncbi:MAG: hypothetical protein P4L91_01520 [Burkholderiaceae bacterium]|nr:hypothetical protein [Burkholderiaceae bacterium]
MISKMKSMSCEILQPKRFDQELTELLKSDVYAPKNHNNAFPLMLEFNLPSIGMDQTIFSIYSESGKRYIYVGPYKNRLSLEIEENFYLTPEEIPRLPQEGMDSVTFSFLGKKNRTRCVAAQDTLSPIWLTNAKVFINFLPEQEIDEKTGVPIRYSVVVEK